MAQSNRRVVRQKRVSRAPFLILISIILALAVTLAVSFAFFISDDLTRPNVDKLSITAQKLLSAIQFLLDFVFTAFFRRKTS